MKKSGHKSFFVILIILIILFLIGSSIWGQNKGKLTYSELLKQIQSNNVESINIDYYGTSAEVKLKKADSLEQLIFQMLRI